MGNKTLILFFATLSFLFAQSSYPEIDKLIEKVKTKRVGLDIATIKKLKNPFVNEKKLKIIKLKAQKKKFKRKKIILRLSSIFSNRARINGKWYRVGSKIGSYRLNHIAENYVVLSRGTRELRLFLHRKKKKLIRTWSR